MTSERKELTKLSKASPVQITMNDARSCDVDGIETAVVSDISAAVLYRAKDGEIRMIHLPLVTMTSVEPLATNA